jgi:hypothetical protein
VALLAALALAGRRGGRIMASTGLSADFFPRGARFRGAGFRAGIFAAADFPDFFGVFASDFFAAGFFADRGFAFPNVPVLRII